MFIRVTDVVVVAVFQAVPSANANGIVLVAITVAIPFRDVRTSALKDGSKPSADPTGINLGA